MSAPANWNGRIRQTHRWVSVAFTLSVVAASIALSRATPVVWVSYLPLAPLALLVVTGLYLFALPYVARWWGGSG